MRGWDQQIQNSLRQADQLTQVARELSVTRRSPDGAVTVTVDSGGNVTALDLGEAALRKRAPELSAEIMSTMRAAQSQLAARMQEAVTPILGDSTATEAIVGGLKEKFPEPPPEPPSGQQPPHPGPPPPPPPPAPGAFPGAPQGAGPAQQGTTPAPGAAPRRAARPDDDEDFGNRDWASDRKGW
ncbi:MULTISPECIES: YbaB/EbfC family nucleoid-associated protein [Actinosynnema]|uniref:YbaB/EbfC family nucleoid-associated protein n=1 Tax=Actinosynnema TaxID=40566 RepID=UPI0020A502D6|nr:YbaB/EbfC family nucleoid-associated protein [Actinosynnema pretiosum]MCP2094679.1 YbaB/EbfC DNA-binding family protein [Actinosynnema pretiosum]